MDHIPASGQRRTGTETTADPYKTNNKCHTLTGPRKLCWLVRNTRDYCNDGRPNLDELCKPNDMMRFWVAARMYMLLYMF